MSEFTEQHIRMEAKLDKVAEDIGSINIVLAKQSVILDEHVKRTNLLEGQIEPIKTHVAMVSGAIKLISIIAVILGIIVTIKQLL